jgi:(p)ppGpp synthase/HD superfamily hydrolase
MKQATTQTGNLQQPSLHDALEFARAAHQGQTRRQNGRPFIEHPVAVVELLAAREQPDEILAAGYLHDTVEKCDGVTLKGLEERFGPTIAAIVDALTEDGTIDDYDERKRGLRTKALSAGRPAAVVYAADRLANINDWRALADEERAQAAARLGTDFDSRMTLWAEDLAALSEYDGELPFLAEIEIELRILRGEAA